MEVLLQPLCISHARLNLAFISRSYADALACFSTLRHLILGRPPGHRATQSGMVHDSRLLMCRLVHTGFIFQGAAGWVHGACDPQRCPNESDLTPTPTSWWQNILKQRDSLGLHDALNHIFRIWTWVTLTTRHSKHSGISFRDITANADLQKQQPLTYDTVEEYRSCGK